MSRLQDCPQVPVSWGELIDKITILRIKQARITEAEARQNVARELVLLDRVAAEAMSYVGDLIGKLQAVNEELWEIEDAIREREAAGDFGGRFVALARSVYRKNDLRAAIKREINRQLGSALVEEKSYAARHAVRPAMRLSAPG